MMNRAIGARELSEQKTKFEYGQNLILTMRVVYIFHFWTMLIFVLFSEQLRIKY